MEQLLNKRLANVAYLHQYFVSSSSAPALFCDVTRLDSLMLLQLYREHPERAGKHVGLLVLGISFGKLIDSFEGDDTASVEQRIQALSDLVQLCAEFERWAGGTPVGPVRNEPYSSTPTVMGQRFVLDAASGRAVRAVHVLWLPERQPSKLTLQSVAFGSARDGAFALSDQLADSIDKQYQFLLLPSYVSQLCDPLEVTVALLDVVAAYIRLLLVAPGADGDSESKSDASEALAQSASLDGVAVMLQLWTRADKFLQKVVFGPLLADLMQAAQASNTRTFAALRGRA